MKILKSIIGVVLVGTVAFAGTTYYFSSGAAKEAQEWSKKISQTAPDFKVVNNQYKRGFLRSTQDITYELPKIGNVIHRVTLHSVIFHGPFPAFGGVGKARIEQTLVFDTEAAKVLNKLFGGKQPIEAITKVGLLGGGVTELKGSTATYKEGDKDISWEGFTGTIRFAKGMASYSGEIVAPGVNVNSKEGNGKFKNLTIKFDQKKLANTETLYLGTSSFNLASITFSKKGNEDVVINNVSVNGDVTSSDGKYMDVVGRMLAADIRSAVFSANNAEYAFSIKHLHIPTFDQLNKDMQAVNEKLSASNDGGKSSDTEIMQSFVALLQKHGVEILKHEPIFAIDNIGFKHKAGEAKFNGSVKFVGVTENDIKVPQSLIGKIEANANFSITEELINSMQSTFQTNMMKGQQLTAEENAQFAAQAKAGTEQKLAQLTSDGYVKRENGMLSSVLIFKGGQLTVNGKPLNPMAGAAIPQ